LKWLLAICLYFSFFPRAFGPIKTGTSLASERIEMFLKETISQQLATAIKAKDVVRIARRKLTT